MKATLIQLLEMAAGFGVGFVLFRERNPYPFYLAGAGWVASIVAFVLFD